MCGRPARAESAPWSFAPGKREVDLVLAGVDEKTAGGFGAGEILVARHAERAQVIHAGNAVDDGVQVRQLRLAAEVPAGAVAPAAQWMQEGRELRPDGLLHFAGVLDGRQRH